MLIIVADTGNVMCINTCGIDVVANRVEIGISDTTAKNSSIINTCVEALGFKTGMVRIYNSEEQNDWDF